MKTKDLGLSDLIGKLAEKKAKIEHKEKLLREKGRKLKTKRFIEIGVIASRFGLDVLDDATLVGAFLELQEKAKEASTLSNWKNRGESVTKTHLSPLIVSFNSDPSNEIRTALKEKKFKWNGFRGEWYGYGIKEEVQELVHECEGKVELIKG